MIKLFTNIEQIRLLKSKSTDLDWYYSKHFWKLKLLIRDLLFATFMKNPRTLVALHRKPSTEICYSYNVEVNSTQERTMHQYRTHSCSLLVLPIVP